MTSVARPTSTADERRRRHSSSWRHGTLHMLLAFERELNPIYTEYDGRPLLQDLYRGEGATDDAIAEPNTLMCAAE